MFFYGGILALVLPLLALMLLWAQNNRIKVLEFELKALQKAFMAMRDRLAEAEGARPAQARSEDEAVADPGEKSQMPADASAQAFSDGSPDMTEALADETADEPVEIETTAAAAHAASEAIGEEVPTTAPAPKEGRDLESALGGRWAVWVGGLALALGGVFLVRYSIEAGLLGPKVRLLLAALLGIASAGGGEYLRRSGLRLPVGGIDGAYLPGILTAAGAFILFGTVYAAHGYYGFIGQATGFVLLGGIGLATIALSLLHGQLFGGLGLVGSLTTPALVASDAPSPWALFGFLAVVVVATAFVARIGRWWPMMTASVAGTGAWCLAYIWNVPELSFAAIAFIAIVPVATLLVVWHRDGDDDIGAPDILVPALAVAIFGGLEVLALATVVGGQPDGGTIAIAVIVAVLMAGAAWRPTALPLLVAAGTATLMWQLWAYFADFDVFAGFSGMVAEVDPQATPRLMIMTSLVIAGLFLAGGIAQARRLTALAPWPAAVWALFAVLVPLTVATLMWTGFGNINRDLGYAVLLLAVAVVLATGAELADKGDPPAPFNDPAVTVFSTGALAGLLLAIHAGFGPGMTTVLCGLVIPLPAVLPHIRAWWAPPALSVAVSLVTLARIALDPSIVGEFALGTTPVFNWLLPGYAVPALGAGVAAWQLRQVADGRMRLVQEAFAALFALLTAAILVRHAMNGGKIYSDSLSLAEQAIYTLIAIGGGAILVALDTRSPSPVFRIGSMIVGGLSMVSIVLAHFVTLNPLVTNEPTGAIPFFNLLLIAYLLPAAAMAALALYARPKRPRPYVACLGLTAAALAFAYVTLSIRRLYWGEFIGSWKGMTDWEAYTYSAAWLALGVAILVIGIRLGSTALRLASAALIVIAVAKVFLFDMSQLEGVLRALSFIGLGAVLIGIGIFYQRMLAAGRAATRDHNDIEPAGV